MVSNGKDTLKVQLADTLTGLKSIGFADSKVSIGSTGINAGGLTITKVGNGTEDTDAANVGQVNAAKAAATTELVAGKNVTVSKDTTSTKDGHTIYTVTADFKGADVSGSNAVVYDTSTKDKVTLGGSGSTTPVKLTNLAEGEISSTSTDAVTGKQLNEVIAYRNQTINVAGDSGSAVKLNHGNCERHLSPGPGGYFRNQRRSGADVYGSSISAGGVPDQQFRYYHQESAGAPGLSG